MHDKPYIRLINTHTKGNGSHNNIYILIQKSILVPIRIAGSSPA